MDKFDGVQRAEILSVDYACEMLSQPREDCKKTGVAKKSLIIRGKKEDASFKDVSESADKSKNRNLPEKKSGFVRFRYVFCAIILGICLLGKFTPVDTLKTASGFIKDELSKDYVSEPYDG